MQANLKLDQAIKSCLDIWQVTCMKDAVLSRAVASLFQQYQPEAKSPVALHQQLGPRILGNSLATCMLHAKVDAWVAPQ